MRVVTGTTQRDWLGDPGVNVGDVGETSVLSICVWAMAGAVSLVCEGEQLCRTQDPHETEPGVGKPVDSHLWLDKTC